jgi:hypothetical protein
MIALEIAGVRVGLHTDSGDLRAQIAQRFGKFVSEGPAHLTMALKTWARDHWLGASPRLLCTGPARYDVDYGAVRGRLDLRAGHCELELPGDALYVDAALRIVLSRLLVQRDGLLIHACGFVRRGRGYVLFGPSGIGKTTAVRDVPAAEVLSDEIIAVRVEDGALVGYGTPFYGDLGWSNPGRAPLAVLGRLHQGAEGIALLTPAEATATLLNSTLFFSDDPDSVARVFAVASQIATVGISAVTVRRDTHVATWIDTHPA